MRLRVVAHSLSSVIGMHMGGYRERRPELVRECYQDLHRRLAAGELDPLVSEVIGFDAVPTALRRLAEGKTTGRMVFVPDQASSRG